MKITTTALYTAAPTYVVIHNDKLSYLVLDGTPNPSFEVVAHTAYGEEVALFQHNPQRYTMYVQGYAVETIAPISRIIECMDHLVTSVPILLLQQGKDARKSLPTIRSPYAFVVETETYRLLYGRVLFSDVHRLHNAGILVSNEPVVWNGYRIEVVTGFPRHTLRIAVNTPQAKGWVVDQRDVAAFFRAM